MARTKSKSPKNFYFSQETEDAIIRYNLLESSEEREVIYKTYLHEPFNKMAEIIIRKWGFDYLQAAHGYDSLKEQLVGFLIMNLGKFKQESGKAFSYFSVIAKNYCIHHNNKQYRQDKHNISLSDDNDSDVSMEQLLSIEAPDPYEHEDTKEFFILLVEYWDTHVTRFFKKKRDIEIAQAIIELMRKVDDIENFNKKALYMMIREITSVHGEDPAKTAYITKVVNKMKEIIIKQLKQYNKDGTINLENSEFFKY